MALKFICLIFLKSIDAVVDITKDLTFESYYADFKTRRAVERRVEIISEATRHIPSFPATRGERSPRLATCSGTNIMASTTF